MLAVAEHPEGNAVRARVNVKYGKFSYRIGYSTGNDYAIRFRHHDNIHKRQWLQRLCILHDAGDRALGALAKQAIGTPERDKQRKGKTEGKLPEQQRRLRGMRARMISL